MALHSVTRRRAPAGALAVGGRPRRRVWRHGRRCAGPRGREGPGDRDLHVQPGRVAPRGAARLYLLDEFNKTNEQKITVNVRGAGATALDKYKSSAGGTPPDIAYAAYYHTADMFAADAGGRGPELKAEKGLGRQRADMYPAMLESSTWTGKLVSLPGYTQRGHDLQHRPLAAGRGGFPGRAGPGTISAPPCRSSPGARGSPPSP